LPYHAIASSSRSARDSARAPLEHRLGGAVAELAGTRGHPEQQRAGVAVAPAHLVQRLAEPVVALAGDVGGDAAADQRQLGDRLVPQVGVGQVLRARDPLGRGERRGAELGEMVLGADRQRVRWVLDRERAVGRRGGRSGPGLGDPVHRGADVAGLTRVPGGQHLLVGPRRGLAVAALPRAVGEPPGDLARERRAGAGGDLRELAKRRLGARGVAAMQRDHAAQPQRIVADRQAVVVDAGQPGARGRQIAGVVGAERVAELAHGLGVGGARRLGARGVCRGVDGGRAWRAAGGCGALRLCGPRRSRAWRAAGGCGALRLCGPRRGRACEGRPHRPSRPPEVPES